MTCSPDDANGWTVSGRPYVLTLLALAAPVLCGCDDWGLPTPGLGTALAATVLPSSADKPGLVAVGESAARALRAPSKTGDGTGLGARSEPDRGKCPADMVHVTGNYCPDVVQRCLRYLDPPGRYHEFRCAEYAPSLCASKQRKPMDFCIDRGEYTATGEALPANHQSFTHAKRTCATLGKRVCRESEWNFACEGEEMRPYPYGFTRDASRCNADHEDIVTPEGKLRDLRAPSGTHPGCASPFGVLDMAGNLEEFVAIDGSTPVRPAMKGAYWQPSRNACRAAQTAHDRFYHGTETGFRCCADPER